MKKLLLTVFALGSMLTAKSQVIFYESFDGIPGDASGGAGTYAFPTGWLLHNVDNLTAATNVAYVNEAWERREDFANNVLDSAAFSTSWYTPAGTSDDWMWTPPIAVLANSVLTWNALTYDALYQDGYEVRVMVAPTVPTGGTGSLGNDVSASTQIFSVAAEASTWTTHNVSLNAYAGQTIRIAYRNNSTDKFLLLIDDVKVEVATPYDANLVSLDTVPEYTILPKNQVYSMPTAATVTNSGTNTLTNVALTLNVYDGVFAQIATQTGTPVASIAPTASSSVSAGNYTISAIPDVYTFEYIVSHANTDNNPSNDTLYSGIIVDDSTFARDNGNVTGGLGIGAGNGGYLGQQFTITASSSLTSISYFVNAGNLNDRTACVLWNMSGGAPSAIIASTDTIFYPDVIAELITLPMSGGPLTLAPGTYVATVVEFDSTLQLAQTSGIFTVGTTWVDWPTSPLPGWGHNEDFGAGFAKSYVVRLNLSPDCSSLNANATSVNATCSTCADGSASSAPTGGTPPFTYAWSSGGTASTASGLLPGSYTVTVTDAIGCTTTGSAFVSFPNAIDENTISAAINIYPNPGKDVFNVTIPQGFGDHAQMVVTNDLGKILSTKSVASFGKNEIDLSDLAAGKYIVTLYSSKYTVHKNLTIIK